MRSQVARLDTVRRSLSHSRRRRRHNRRMEGATTTATKTVVPSVKATAPRSFWRSFESMATATPGLRRPTARCRHPADRRRRRRCRRGSGCGRTPPTGSGRTSTYGACVLSTPLSRGALAIGKREVVGAAARAGRRSDLRPPAHMRTLMQLQCNQPLPLRSACAKSWDLSSPADSNK